MSLYHGLLSPSSGPLAVRTRCSGGRPALGVGMWLRVPSGCLQCPEAECHVGLGLSSFLFSASCRPLLALTATAMYPHPCVHAQLACSEPASAHNECQTNTRLEYTALLINDWCLCNTGQLQCHVPPPAHVTCDTAVATSPNTGS